MKRIYVLFILCVGTIRAMQLVPLRDGSILFSDAVEKTLWNVRRLEKSELLGILAIYSLQQKAQGHELKAPDRDHQELLDRIKFILRQYGLVAADGSMSDVVRSVVLSSVKFNHETSQLWIRYPIVANQ